MIALEALQRLAHRRAADAELGAELRLRPDAARCQLQGDDHLFQARAGLLGKTLPGSPAERTAVAARAWSTAACPGRHFRRPARAERVDLVWSWSTACPGAFAEH